MKKTRGMDRVNQRDICALIKKAVTDGEAERAAQQVYGALAALYPAENVLEEGLVKGMLQVAERFREERVMVPEVLMSARAFQAGLSVVLPRLKKRRPLRLVKVVIGTVAGDLHDIGKNLVKVLLITTGAAVVDLGVDVSARDFVRAVVREKPHILMMSSLLTTTMGAMKEVIEALAEKGLRDKLTIMVGGTPVTAEFARLIGADHYFVDAPELREFFLESSFA